MKIEIIDGDITKQNVDAIVNAGHEALMGGGGVDGAIHRAAGPGLIRECMAIPCSEPGIRCRVGEAHITSGCKLPAKHVIHTVAPKFVGAVTNSRLQRDSSGRVTLRTALMESLYINAHPGTEEDLANCYRNCLALASQQGLKSVAFCSLGTGGHAWPIEVAAPIAVRTVMEAEAPGVELVRFVTFGKFDYDHYVKAYAALGGV